MRCRALTALCSVKSVCVCVCVCVSLTQLEHRFLSATTDTYIRALVCTHLSLFLARRVCVDHFVRTAGLFCGGQHTFYPSETETSITWEGAWRGGVPPVAGTQQPAGPVPEGRLACWGMFGLRSLRAASSDAERESRNFTNEIDAG